MPLTAPVGYLYWYTSSIVLFLLTLLNIGTKLFRYFTQPRNVRRLSLPNSPGYGAPPPLLPTVSTGVPAESPTSSTDTAEEKFRPRSVSSSASRRSPSPLGRARRLLRAGTVLLSKYVGLTALSYPSIRLKFWQKVKRQSKRAIPTPELLWMGGYTIGCLILSFYGTGWDVLTYSNQAAWLACAQVPMIIALAGKNNLVSFLTGIPYDKLNFLHRAAGRLCLLGIWIHAGGHWYLLGGWTSANWHAHISQWGFTGTFAFTLMTVISSPWFRRRMFEFFLVAHILLAALSLAAFIMHWRAVDIWVYPGIGLWAADRLFRSLRLVVLNKLWMRPTLNAAHIPSRATLTTLTPSTILITFPAPSKALTWSAGHHFYVVMPGMSRLPWEAHPFTAITIPRKPSADGAITTGGELSFIVRVRDGFTKRMKDKIDEARKERCLGLEEKCEISIPAAVEGPYGEPTDFSDYEGVLIFAGGSGVSFAVANLLQIVADVAAGKSRVKVVEIVWMVKSRLHLDWISPILLANIKAIPPNLSVTLHVHVTRQTVPRMSLSSTGDWQAYLAEHTSTGQRRRRSRLMSTFSWATFRSDGSWGRKSIDGGTRRGSIMPPPEPKPSKKKWGSKAAKNGNGRKQSVMSSGGESDAEGSHAGSGGGPPHNTDVVPAFSWTEGYADGAMPSAKTSPNDVDQPKNQFKFAEPFAPVSEQNELEIVVAQPTPTDGVAPRETFTAPDAIPSDDDEDEKEANDLVGPAGESGPFTDPFAAGRRRSSAHARARAHIHASAYGRRVSEMSEASSGGSGSGSRRGSSAWIPGQIPDSPTQSLRSATATPPLGWSHRGSIPRKTSITIDEPIMPPRRPSVTIEDSPRRMSIPLALPGRRPSMPNLLMQATAHSMQRSASGGGGPLRSSASASPLQQQAHIPGEHRASTGSASSAPSPSTPPKPTSILIPKPARLQPSPVFFEKMPPHLTPAQELAPDMSRSSSMASGVSMASFSAPVPLPPTALARPSEISRPGTPNLAFKQLQEATHSTPAELRKSIVALNNIPDPKERRQSIDVVLGPAEGALRRRGSIGLENLVKWHEGRADIDGMLREVMDRISESDSSSTSMVPKSSEVDEEKGERQRARPQGVRGGRAPRVVVGACGPKSLLDAARNAVRGEMSASSALQGQVGVDFHAETFGW